MSGGCLSLRQRHPWYSLSFVGGNKFYIYIFLTLNVGSEPLNVVCFNFRWLPESARWLLVKGRADAAHRYIMKCAEMNNRTKCVASVTPTVLFVWFLPYCSNEQILKTLLNKLIHNFSHQESNLFIKTDKVAVLPRAGHSNIYCIAPPAGQGCELYKLCLLTLTQSL